MEERAPFFGNASQGRRLVAIITVIVLLATMTLLPAPTFQTSETSAEGKGDAAAQQGSYGEAQTLYRQAFEEAETDALRGGLCMKRGALYVLMGQAQEAMEELSLALQYEPALYQARLLRAQIYIQQGNKELALAEQQAYLALKPEDANVRYQRANILFQLARYGEAYQEYERVYESSQSADALLGAARAALLAERYADAYPLYEKLNRQEETQENLLGLAQSAYASGRYAAAEACLTDDALNGFDEAGELYYLRGAARVQQNDLSGGEIDFLQALDEGFSQDADIYDQLSYCQYAQGKYKQTLETGRKAAALYGQRTSEGIYQRMGLSALQTGDYETCIEALTQCIRQNPTRAENQYFRATAYLVTDQYDKARLDYSVVIDAGYKTQECRYNRAVCSLRLGDLKSAREDLDIAAQMMDDPALAASAKELLAQMDAEENGVEGAAGQE